MWGKEKNQLKVRELNDRLMMAERAFTDRDGLSERQWYKHLVSIFMTPVGMFWCYNGWLQNSSNPVHFLSLEMTHSLTGPPINSVALLCDPVLVRRSLIRFNPKTRPIYFLSLEPGLGSTHFILKFIILSGRSNRQSEREHEIIEAHT